MPKRSQLNILLSPLLIAKVKKNSRREGLSITEYMTKLISSDQLKNQQSEDESLITRVANLEEQIYSLKSRCPGQLKNKNLMPFTQKEADNCTDFIRAVFKKIIEVRRLNSNKEGWEDFFPHLSVLDLWDLSLTNRLKEVLLFEEPEPWTSSELNRLTNYKNYSCPIREALISWSKIDDIPDQQTICDEGEKIVSSLFFR